MLLVNTLLKNNEGHMERIVFMDNVICYTISLPKNEMPIKKLVSDIKQALEDGLLHICLEEKINPIIWDKLSDKQKDMTDKAYEIVKEVISMAGNKIFDKNFRCNVIKEVAHKLSTTIKSVYKYLKRYWQGGMNKIALVPHFKNCGAKGEEREPQECALGRRRDDGIESFKMTDKVKKYFKSCLESNFYSHKRLSLIKCYYLLLNEYFKDVLNKVGEYPSFGQFRYYFDKTRDLKKEYCKRVGDKEYNQKHREVLGQSNYNTIPSTVQIDSTQADFYLVSEYDRSKLVGRPTVTIAMDVVTRTIVGVSVGFESPSWKTTMMVLSNVAGDKVTFCSRFGIEIKEDEWPISNMIPNRIVTDRGPEFLNSNMQQVVDNLAVVVEYTPSYRADLKGIVERMMGTIQKDIRGFTQSEVSDDIRKKANKYDYRMNASLTLNEFTQLIIKAVLHHNNHHVLSNYQRTQDMIKQEVQPIPLAIWEYAQENMMGYNYVESNFVNLCVMPREQGKVTAKGIEFKNILYGCERGLKEQWFVIARNKGDYQVDVSFDTRDTNKIYVHLEDGSYEMANILNHQEVYKNKTYEEVRLLLKTEKNMINHLKEEHLAATVDYIGDIQEIANVQVEPTKESKASKLKDIKVNKEVEILMNQEQIVEVRPPKGEVNEPIEEVVEEKEDSVLDRFMKRRLDRDKVVSTLR